MSPSDKADWNPSSPEIQRDQRSAYDKKREHCPVAYSRERGWSVFRHDDVMNILHDPDTFSNEVSSHLSVPNGVDPPEHTQYRAIIEQYFKEERIDRFEQKCREIAVGLIEEIRGDETFEFINSFARSFAVQIQCAFMGWSEEMHRPLREWTLENIQAIRSGDRPAIKRLAETFKTEMKALMEKRRAASLDFDPNTDLTAHLMQQKVDGRRLNDEEIISILRNWTMGEVGTITNAIGILAHFLATHQTVESQLRAGAIPLAKAIDEILRLHGPLVTNRRKTTCPVKINNRKVGSGEPITINWMSANRDPRAFEMPDQFKPHRDQSRNLLFGAGIHKCPAEPLAQMELRVVLDVLLSATTDIALSGNCAPVKASFPESGYERLYLRFKR